MLRILAAFLALLLMAPSALAQCIDINTADASTLDALQGIGPAKAGEIIRYRDSHGAFTSVDQLLDVPGIGQKTLDNMRAQICPIGDDPTAAPPAAPPPTGTSPSSGSTSGGSTTKKSTPAGLVNINTADATALMTMPGIGKVKADAILKDREANGPFATCDDLGRVSGIGPSTLSQIKPYCATE